MKTTITLKNDAASGLGRALPAGRVRVFDGRDFLGESMLPHTPKGVDIHLETGRTHQIRVHFSAIRHPCCGDLTYGADPKLAARLGLERQWLHARALGVAHPADGRGVEITSEYPADLQHALDVLRSS